MSIFKNSNGSVDMKKCRQLISCCLLQNAEESIEHAITHLTGEHISAWDYKRVIIDLAHVAELLFKEQLFRVHPAFIFDKVDEQKFDKTISVTKAIERLQTIAHIEFKDNDYSALKSIIKFRNEIIHYEYAFNEQHVKTVIGTILVFLFKFGLDELDLDWAERRIADKKWLKLNEFASFYEIQKKSLESELFDSGLYIETCPVCFNNFFDVESEICLLCGHREEPHECIECHNIFFKSQIEFSHGGEALCQKCLDYLEGYAAANFEKY